MEDKKKLIDDVATVEDINEVDGEPIYHANEEEGENEEE